MPRLTDYRSQAKNANKHTQRGMGMLEKSIQQDGWIGAITVAADGETFDGSARIETGTSAGFEDAIVVRSDGSKPVVHIREDILTADDPRAKRLGVAANRVAAVDLEWDTDVLAELNDEGLLDGLFFENELDALLASIDVAAAGDGGDDYEDAGSDAPTRVQPGDVWQVGRHRIACIDCTDVEAVERLLDGIKPNMVFADPPYGISIVATNGYVGGGEAYDIPFGGRKGYVGGGEAVKASPGLYPIQQRKGLGAVGGAKPFGSKPVRGSVGASNMIPVGKYYPVIGDDSTDTAIEAYNASTVYAPDAVQVWWGGNYYANALPPSSCWLVWDKENTGNFADAELAWTNQKTAVRIFKHMWNGLMKASEKGVRRVHPTQKPVALAEWVFTQYGKEGDIVFDPFLGSGMSLIAGERTKRSVYGCELSPQYCDVILRRAEAEGITPIERISTSTTEQEVQAMAVSA